MPRRPRFRSASDRLSASPPVPGRRLAPRSTAGTACGSARWAVTAPACPARSRMAGGPMARRLRQGSAPPPSKPRVPLAVGAVLWSGARVIPGSGDRVVVEEPDGTQAVTTNDDGILSRPTRKVGAVPGDDGSTRAVGATKPRFVSSPCAPPAAPRSEPARVMPEGQRFVALGVTIERAGRNPGDAERCGKKRPPGSSRPPGRRSAQIASVADRAGRHYRRGQIRARQSVLVPEIEVAAITLPTNPAAIPTARAGWLADFGLAIAGAIREVPRGGPGRPPAPSL